MGVSARIHVYVTYLELIRYLSMMMEGVERTAPISTVGPPVKPPPPPSDEDQWELEAKVSAFGSEAVQAGLQDWLSRVRDFYSAVFQLNQMKESGRTATELQAEWGVDLAGQRQRLDSKRQELRDFAADLRKRILEELRGEAN
jgi:hypothetical protein